MSELLEFHDKVDEDSHARFQRWRSDNFSNGFFLNYKSPGNIMLHRSPCWHHGDTDWAAGEDGWGSLTKFKKVCSLDRVELEHWANEHGSGTLKKCQHCFSA